MSLGLFGAVLAAVLVVLCLDRASRLRTVVTGLAGIMLGVVIAGSNGVLVEPAHKLVDGVRAGLTAVAEQIGGDEKPAPGDGKPATADEKPATGEKAGDTATPADKAPQAEK
jgi:hypothetical protein